MTAQDELLFRLEAARALNQDLIKRIGELEALVATLSEKLAECAQKLAKCSERKK